ncbi:MAG TPA: DUF488 family protein [Coriobacteriia bacterium]|nr:DUF488 family protein [Coriobacteriia bacterium]
MIGIKSVRDPRRPEDGYRILIEPRWPSGLPKGKAGGVDWIKSLYPSRNLQGWMQRNPRKLSGFRDSYLLELAHNEAAVEKVCRLHRERGTVTIVAPPDDDTWGIYETLVQYLRTMCE